ncbi:MAG: DUF1501 domain-containing protein [Gemmataceae bacterium]
MTDHPTRRQFLATGAALAGSAALGAPPPQTAAKPTADSVIFLMLTGGPSQLDTFDPKPNARSDIRGPFRAIPTRVPGTQLSELFPKMAAMADKFSLIRSMTSDIPPIHELGFQAVNTGRVFGTGPAWPSAGAVVAHLRGERDRCPPWWAFGEHPTTGTTLPTGSDRGFLPVPPYWPCRPSVNDGFGATCDLALMAVKSGARFVTVNMFETVFDAPSWDCHADGGSLACDLSDYRDTVAPLFDTAFARLLTSLSNHGLLDRTLVVATGEFGRTPHPNCNGGRDHWTRCWTTILAGGGVQGGRVVGRSDAVAGEPADRPVTPAELVATIFHALGIPPHATIPGPDGKPVRVSDAAPVRELF